MSWGKNMKACVTGGCGFLGMELVSQLVQLGADVTVLDKLTYAGEHNWRDLPPTVNLFEGDVVLAMADTIRLHGPFDIMFHLAAETHVDRSIIDGETFAATNVLGTYAVLEAARTCGFRVVHVSTDEVYGPMEGGRYAYEHDPFAPSSPYAASKAAGDLAAQAYHKTHGLDVVIVRPSNCYGPQQFPEKLLPLSIVRAMDNRPIPVYGDGEQVRSWLYVGDAVQGILAVGEKGRRGEAYNLGPGDDNEWTNLTVLKLLLKKMGKPETLLQHVDDRLGHDRRYSMDIAKANIELDLWPSAEFDWGLGQTIRWYVAHRAW